MWGCNSLILFPNTLYCTYIMLLVTMGRSSEWGRCFIIYWRWPLSEAMLCKHKWPGRFRSNTSLHCELAHALCCPLQAIHSVIFVVVDRHWDTLTCWETLSTLNSAKRLMSCSCKRSQGYYCRFCEFYALIISCSLSWKLLFGVHIYIPQIYTK